MNDQQFQQIAMALNRLDGFVKQTIQQQLYLRRKLCAMEATQRLLSAGREPKCPVIFRSQFGEDALLWDLFNGQLDGFFIEVGALDGVTYSVSYAFEAIGWTGLLIEATPDMAANCEAARPNSRVVHAAASKRGSSGTTKFNIVRGGGGDLLNFHTTDPSHLQRIQNEGAHVVQLEVPLTTMNDLLADHHKPIDFAVIDVEGGELDLLDGFDLNRFRPRVLVVEENVPTPSSPLTAYLQERGYIIVWRQWVNNIYIRREETTLLARASQIIA